MKKYMNQGFTLTELMIVIAIIGILAMVSTPTNQENIQTQSDNLIINRASTFFPTIISLIEDKYNSYLARLQTRNSFKATASLQTSIDIYYADNKNFNNIIYDRDIIKEIQNFNDKYSSQNLVSVENTTGVITIYFTDGLNKGKTFTLTPIFLKNKREIATWNCGGSVKPQHFPGACKVSANITQIIKESHEKVY